MKKVFFFCWSVLSMNSIYNLFDINDFNRLCVQESTTFNILHLNIRSGSGNNFDKLCLNLIEIKMKFSVIVLSETCLLPNENHPVVEDFTSYAVCRNS